MNSRIPIFYACDDNFVKYMIVSIRSIMENASENRTYEIHILHTEISQRMKDMVSQMETPRFHFVFDHVGEQLSQISDKLPIRDYYTKTTYYRFFLAELYPEYEKAIYIDSDTIVLGDMAELYDHELGDCYVGAANEQVMIQVDTYGEYVEQVLGIERSQYFNAGLLLVNCRKFREEKVLEQFIDFLYVYDFVVTQDEDYLNLICKDKVLWLEQQWNTEVFGQIPVEESTWKMIHYIMASKPWHYEECMAKEYFWKYAEMTPVLEEIQKVLQDYSSQEKEVDKKAGESLLETARKEISKEDNYLNLLKAGKLKSKDRLKVLDRIARLESSGNFDVDVEEDPPTRELRPEEIDYLRKKISSRIKAKMTYHVARGYMNKLIKEQKLIIKEIRGIEHFQNLNSGSVITCNHFSAMDSFAMQIAYEAAQQKGRTLFRVIREGNYTNFPGFYGMLMRNCNTFPLSSNRDTMKKFMRSMKQILRNGNFVLVYPEQSMWWNYKKPKPLKKGAYIFAVQAMVPVLPCFITMEDSSVLGDDGFYVQEYTIHVGEPIYPDSTLSQGENVERMMEKNAETWKEIYEKTYGEELITGADTVSGRSRGGIVS